MRQVPLDFSIYRLLIIVLIELLDFIAASPSILHTSISCDKSDFLLKISFNETFTGLIYTELGSPNCVYVNASIQRNTHYQVKIPLAGCETRRNNDGNLENEIVIQNGDSFRPGADRKFLLTCIPAAPKFRDSLVTVNFGGITIDQSTTAATMEGKQKLDYTVSVLDASQPGEPPLKRPLTVGDKVIYVVRVSSPTKARIGRCWATDGSSNLELSDKEGCSLQKSGNVWNDFEVEEKEEGTTYSNRIKAWAFPTSNEVNIFCNLHVCSSCAQTRCSARRRRANGAITAKSIDNPLEPLDFRLVGDETADDDVAPPIPIYATLRLRRQSEVLISEQPIDTNTVPRGSSTALKTTSSLLTLITFLLFFC